MRATPPVDTAAPSVPRSKADRLALSVVIPLKASRPSTTLGLHLQQLVEVADEVLVVDGSPPEVFAEHHRRWPAEVRHVPVDPRHQVRFGKVAGVRTGAELARNDVIVLSDDDVRWTPALLRRAVDEVAHLDLLRPQNAFVEHRWHTHWDTGRTLLNRVHGGDWPGTTVVRRDVLLADGCYLDVLFENRALEREVGRRGGRTAVRLDLLVPRLAPDTAHFLDQRVRQAYDDLDRPLRMAASLALAPFVLWPGGRAGRRVLGVAGVAVVAAEVGRRRAGGAAVFPRHAALWGPLWVAERSVTSWVALWCRVVHGAVPYGGRWIPTTSPTTASRPDRARSGVTPDRGVTGDPIGW